MELRLPDMQLPTSYHVCCIRAAFWPTGWGCVRAQSGDPSNTVLSDRGVVRCGDALGANVGQRECHPKLSRFSTERNPIFW
jgi:hypothetical protein